MTSHPLSRAGLSNLIGVGNAVVADFAECVEWFDGDCTTGHKPRVICSLINEVILETGNPVDVGKADAVGMVAAADVELVKSDNSRHGLHSLFAIPLAALSCLAAEIDRENVAVSP